MMPDAFNCDTSRAKSSKRSETSGRIIAPDWNGQAVPSTRANTVQIKTGVFKVEFAGGTVSVKKSARTK